MAQPSLAVLRGPVQIDNRVANIHPEDWRRNIYKYTPLGGRFPLTVMMDAVGSRSTTSRKFHWWEQAYNTEAGTVTDVYNDSALSSAYASGGVSGTLLYIAMTSTNAKLFRVGDIMQITETANYARRHGVVTVVNTTGSDSTSYVAWVLKETDTSNKLASSALVFTILSRAENEIAELPESRFEDPVEYYNYSQIMMEAAESSDREKIEQERVDPLFTKRLRAQALERLMKRREMLRFFGFYAKDGTKTYSKGFYQFLDATTNIVDWKADTTYSSAGQTWLAGGYDFLLNLSEFRHRYSKTTEPFVFTSGMVIRDIQKLMYDRGHYELEAGATSYGINVRKLNLGGETWNLVENPIFTTNPAYQRSMAVVEVELLKMRTMQPLYEVKPGDNVDGYTFVTGSKYGWVVDEGLEMDGFDNHLWIDNLGTDK